MRCSKTTALAFFELISRTYPLTVDSASATWPPRLRSRISISNLTRRILHNTCHWWASKTFGALFGLSKLSRFCRNEKHSSGNGGPRCVESKLTIRLAISLRMVGVCQARICHLGRRLDGKNVNFYTSKIKLLYL